MIRKPSGRGAGLIIGSTKAGPPKGAHGVARAPPCPATGIPARHRKKRPDRSLLQPWRNSDGAPDREKPSERGTPDGTKSSRVGGERSVPRGRGSRGRTEKKGRRTRQCPARHRRVGAPFKGPQPQTRVFATRKPQKFSRGTFSPVTDQNRGEAAHCSYRSQLACLVPRPPLCRNGPRVRWPGAVPGSEGDQEMYGKCLLFSLRSKISEFRHPSVQGFQKQDCEPGMAFSGARKAVSPQPLRPGLVILCVNIWRIQQFCPRDGNPAFLPRENEGRNTPGPRGFSGRRWGTPVGTRTSPRSRSRGRSRPFRSGLESPILTLSPAPPPGHSGRARGSRGSVRHGPVPW